MPTLEELEERVTELERTLPTLRREQIDTGPIEARLNALQQQVAELQRRLSVQEQATGQSGQQLVQRLDRLEKALIYQFHTIDERFDAQTTSIRAQFEETNVPLTMLTVTVQSQGQDIKEMKEDIKGISGHLDGIESHLDGMDRRFDSLESKMNGRFDQVIALLSRLRE